MNDLMERSADALTEEDQSVDAVFEQEVPGKKSQLSIFILGIVIVILAVAVFFLFKSSTSIAAGALAGGYSAAYGTERDDAYQKLYNAAFDRAEQKYHVSNRVTISIENLKEVQNLEVLKFSAIEYVTTDRDSNSSNATAWLKVPGEGTFTVNLQAAEFVVDNEHSHVLARLPLPELGEIKITNREIMLFDGSTWKNGNYSEGVGLANALEREALSKIEKTLMSNAGAYDAAKSAASSLVENMVMQFNPDVDDLTVEVEFMS